MVAEAVLDAPSGVVPSDIQNVSTYSRRAALVSALSGSAAVLLPLAGASATVPAAPADLPERAALLSAITSGASDSVVLSKIDALVPFDPSKGRGAAEKDDVAGEWELIWS